MSSLFGGSNEKKDDGIVKQISVAIGLEPKSELEEACDTCGLTRMQRYSCFGVLFCIGGLMSWLAFISIANPRKFALLYSLGNVVALCGSFFLAGFVSQIKAMFKFKRIIPTCVYITAMIMTIVAAVHGWSIWIVLLFALIQFCALIYYMLTYIPFGTTMLKNALFCGKC
ncbi:MAG: hypothetical protein Edafosvirus3_88 [Edafosvirus sp.]|uniref:Vesicle transport protein n=1 Tax=Edafosvirus sp. TaxID=2487765 RepID=A0A3G4ZSY2_9VIRU|nr:MAG: hypothetical protein Edafosvirus3_88 [Edafosvirus sp.]